MKMNSFVFSTLLSSIVIGFFAVIVFFSGSMFLKNIIEIATGKTKRLEVYWLALFGLGAVFGIFCLIRAFGH
jgi:hypothetical protein